MRCSWMVLGILGLALFAGVTGCSQYAERLAYRNHVGSLEPISEEEEDPNKAVTDDGSIVFTQERLEISLRPMSEEELNRQFAAATAAGVNPYTFGDTKWFRVDEVPRRFTVFRLTVKNYQYPKVYIDPTDVLIESDNGRKYYSLSYDQLYVYFRTFSPGGKSGGEMGDRAGNPYKRWQERMSVLNRTMYPSEQVFSGQEADGYLVFQPLHADVSKITVRIPEVAVRFDYRNVPIETIAVDARFHRETGRLYPDGQLELTYEVQ